MKNIEVGNVKPFSQKWDNCLKYLLKNGKPVIMAHTINFRIRTGEYCFGLFNRYSVYSVWISNKESHYGELYEVNNKVVPSILKTSPSTVSLTDLFNLEKSLLMDMDSIYNIKTT